MCVREREHNRVRAVLLHLCQLDGVLTVKESSCVCACESVYVQLRLTGGDSKSRFPAAAGGGSSGSSTLKLTADSPVPTPKQTEASSKPKSTGFFASRRSSQPAVPGTSGQVESPETSPKAKSPRFFGVRRQSSGGPSSPVPAKSTLPTINGTPDKPTRTQNGKLTSVVPQDGGSSSSLVNGITFDGEAKGSPDKAAPPAPERTSSAVSWEFRTDKVCVFNSCLSPSSQHTAVF